MATPRSTTARCSGLKARMTLISTAIQPTVTQPAVSTSLPTWPHDSVCPHSQAMDKRLAIDGDATGFMLPGLAVLHRFW